jgi:hypothetical protein
MVTNTGVQHSDPDSLIRPVFSASRFRPAISSQTLRSIAMNIAIRLSALVLSSTFVLLAGCGGSSSPGSASGGSGSGGSGSSGQLASGGATSLYVIQSTSTGTADSILQFSASSTGNVSPTATLSPPTAMTVDAVATDSSGQIYVGGSIASQAEILVYPAGSTGSAPPSRTIIQIASVGIVPTAMTVDSSGLIYVTGPPIGGTDNGIAIFSASANGSSTPVRLIQGSLAQLSGPTDIAVDASGNVYVTESVQSGNTTTGLITIFPPTANGNVAPTRTISNSAIFAGIALDASGNIFTIEDTITNTSTSAAIAEFSNSASGAATATKTISGTSTGLTLGGGLSRDAVGNLYLVNLTPSGTSSTFSVLGFGPNAQGNVAPGISLASTALTDADPQIAIK